MKNKSLDKFYFFMFGIGYFVISTIIVILGRIFSLFNKRKYSDNQNQVAD